MKHSRFIVTSLAVAGMACAFGAWAQDTGSAMPKPAMPMHQQAMSMHHMAMMGRHDMKVTVTSVDSTTGIVEAKEGDINMRVHFPPSSLADVKAGDTITLHLAFSVDKK